MFKCILGKSGYINQMKTFKVIIKAMLSGTFINDVIQLRGREAHTFVTLSMKKEVASKNVI